MSEVTRVPLERETRETLKALKRGGESYDSVIGRLIANSLLKAVFRCSDCKELSYVEQNGEALKKPLKCEHCGNTEGFDLVPHLSVFRGAGE